MCKKSQHFLCICEKKALKKFGPTTSSYGFCRAKKTAQDALLKMFKKYAHSAVIR